MPSLEDLKSEPVAHTINKPKKAFIPTIQQGDTVDSETSKPIIKRPQTISIDISKGKGQTTKREAADFSSLPVAEENTGNIKVKKVDNIESEIFGPGGPFEKYYNERVEEYVKGMEKIEEEEENRKYEQENEELESDQIQSESSESTKDIPTDIGATNQYRQVDIFSRKNQVENNEPDDAYEEDIEDQDMSEDNNYRFDEEPMDDEEDEAFITEAEKSQATSSNINPVEEYPNAEEVLPEEPVVTPQPQQMKKKVSSPSIAQRLDKITRSYMSYAPEDDEDDQIETTTDDDDQIEALKSLITEKLNPVSHKLNLSGFTVAKKGTTSNNILATESAAVAKWVLPATGTVVMLREISGSNLEAIRSHIEGLPATDMRAALRIIYDHIVSAKPDSFETWLKSVAFADYDHLFMAAYIASFAEANYLPVDCSNPACRKSYLTDNINIMDMVHFTSKETEEKFWDLYKSDIVNGSGLYTTEIIPISDKFAIAFVEPSLYSVLIETNYFNEEFNRRYTQTIAYAPYIDNIYYIDMENRSLVPIDHKIYANNIARTARSKIQRMDKVLNTLNADQHAIIAAYVNKINERVNWMTYRIPETTCPHCGQVNPELGDQSASSLVFTRNRLAVLATI